MSADLLIELRGVRKCFGTVEALAGIDLSVTRGDTIAIIGPSGCGKTTLLRCIELLDEIDVGRIRVAGADVITAAPDSRPVIHVNVNEYRTRVAMVFQNLNIWPHLTVLDNLTLAPRIVSKLEREEVEVRALALLSTMGIEKKVDAYAHRLSGG